MRGEWAEFNPWQVPMSSVTDQAGLEELAGLLGSYKETLFVRVCIAAAETGRVLPCEDRVEPKLRFRRAVAAAG
jgi:hypothetical protein